MVKDSRIILCHSELNTAFFMARFVVNRTSCRSILFIYKFVWLNKSACSITLTIIQQLKFLGQILSTEKDGPTSTRCMSPPTGEQPQRDSRSPFPNHVQERIDPYEHFLEDNIVPTRPRPSQFETSTYS